MNFDNHQLQIRTRWYLDSDITTHALIEIEPWGFAQGQWPNVSMGNTGSVVTDSRAKTLFCFQAPLEAIQEGNYIRYYKDVRV